MNPEQLKIYKREKSRQFNANLKALRLEKKHSSPGTASTAKPPAEPPADRAKPPAEPAEPGLMLEDIFFKLEELESKLSDLLDVKFDELESKLSDLLEVKFAELLEELEELDTEELKPRPPFQLQQNAFA
jgi:hypothetical protein